MSAGIEMLGISSRSSRISEVLTLKLRPNVKLKFRRKKKIAEPGRDESPS